MIGLGFLMRVVQFLLYVGVGAGILIVIFWVINKVIQLVAGQFGLAVTDFWGWFVAKLPKRKVK